MADISSLTIPDGTTVNLKDVFAERSENKTTSITNSSTDVQFPSAKAVYTLFKSIINGNEVSY